MEQVKGLERGLEVLNGLIELETATVRELAAHAGLTQQATYRCLESLRRKGFAFRRNYREPYRATARTLTLGGQMSTNVVMMECAQSVLEGLSKELNWPVSLAAVENEQVKILANVEIRRRKGMHEIAKKGSMLRFYCPSWALFLALSPRDKARKLYLRDIEDHGPELLVRDPDFYDVLLSRIRTNGYVIYDAFRSPQGSAAVPIRDIEGCLYAIEVKFLEAEVARADVEKRIVPGMKAAASSIRSNAEPLLSALSALKALNG